MADLHPALQGLITIIVGVGGCVGYFYFSNLFLDKVLFRAQGPNAGRNINRANIIRPWIALSLYLVYPVLETLRLSVTERVPIPDSAGGFTYKVVWFANYSQMFGEPKFWEAMRNNMLWLIIVPAASTAFGLLSAQLSDRIGWGNIAKSMIFMPMAISFVGASVIWKLIYDTRPAEQDQIGVLNALWMRFEGGFSSVLLLQALPTLLLVAFAALVGWLGYWVAKPLWASSAALSPTREGLWHKALRVVAGLFALWLVVVTLRAGFALLGAALPYGEPQTWLTNTTWNSFLLMVVLIWIQTGFAMVILSAALRGIPEQTIEAAIVDGANPFQIFFRIKVPQIMGTIVVVWTTITLVVLKVFDIVYAMTNGQWETQVLANYMYEKLFRANDWGVGSASAMVIMLLVTPILLWNIHNARKEMR